MHLTWLFKQYILGVSILVLEYYFGTDYNFGGYFGYKIVSYGRTARRQTNFRQKDFFGYLEERKCQRI